MSEQSVEVLYMYNKRRIVLETLKQLIKMKRTKCPPHTTLTMGQYRDYNSVRMTCAGEDLGIESQECMHSIVNARG